MCANIETEFAKVRVTALKFLGDRLFAGIGGDLCVFDVNTREAMFRQNVLGTRPIHGICSNSDFSFIVIYGGTDIVIFECTNEASRVKYNLSSKFNVEHAVWWVECMNDNVTLAMIDGHNVLSLWNWSSGVKVNSVKCQEKCMLYSAKLVGKEWSDLVVLAGTVFQTIVIWGTDEEMISAEDRPVLHRLHGHKGTIYSINYNSNLRRLCSTSDDRSVRVWNVKSSVSSQLTAKDWKDATIQLLFSLFGHTARVFRSVLLAVNNIISIGEDSQLCMWDWEGKCISQRQCHQGGTLWSVDCDEDLALIATGGSDGGISLWHVETSPAVPVEFPITEDEPRRLAILSKHRIVVTTDSGCVNIFHNNVWMEVWKDHRIAKYCLLEVSPSRSLIALATIDGHVCILKYIEDNSDSPLEKIICEQVILGRIYSLIWINEEEFLISGPHGLLYIISLVLNESGGRLRMGQIFQLYDCKDPWVTAAALVDDMLVCGDRNGSIHVYKLDGSYITTLKHLHGRNGVTCLRYLNDRIWSTGRDGTLRQYHLQYPAFTRCIQPRELVADKLAMQWVADIIALNNDILVIGFHDKSCVVWSAKGRTIVANLPCGGGHRSWDIALNSEVLQFAFIKDKAAHMFSYPVKSIYTPPLLEGFHTNEINCMKKLTLNNCTWIVSGGEDNTVRLSRYVDNKWETKSVVRSHLSSIRAIATASLPLFGNFVFTAGGRCQIKVWKVEQHSEDDAVLIEVDSCILNDREMSACRYELVPSNTPQARYMELSVSVDSEDTISVVTIAADSALRLFRFQASENMLIYYKRSLYSSRCLLKVFSVNLSDGSEVICTMATDGKLACWGVNNVSGDLRLWSMLSLHQSGINACDWVSLSENKILLVSGGDDSIVLCMVLKFTTHPELSIVKEAEQISKHGHTSGITGVKIWKDLIISFGSNYRVCIFKWSAISGVDITLLSQYSSFVVDIHGVEAWIDSEDHLTMCVYGIGCEVLRIKYSAECDLSKT